MVFRRIVRLAGGMTKGLSKNEIADAPGGIGTLLELKGENPDAHDVAHLAYVRAGVNAARKGWLARENVINTKPPAAMRAWLEARRQ